ncbi:WhiB family transcriptional regulator [Streptomyces sp. SID3212]|uniref:WhiB family transcriptional regulator n=1 Tax=Streptomyces sp. SID3212 TaxID=2690259 RepID=UPI001369795A|nr:WhiB family transcriptional regulator [Streptomyces sp. SID3212]MYV56479.1 WhiB family transcriptional regulator [Streptomyces sp. SID3212]
MDSSRAWLDHAACLGHDLLFVGTRDAEPRHREAKRICTPCEVRPECLVDALSTEGRLGSTARAVVRGGMGPYQRAQLSAEATAHLIEKGGRP